MGEAVIGDLGRHAVEHQLLTALAVVLEPVQIRLDVDAVLLDNQLHRRGEVEVVVVVSGEVAAAVLVQVELDPFDVIGGCPFGDDLDRVDGNLVDAACVEHAVLAADVGIAEVDDVAESGAGMEVERERHRILAPIGRRDRVRVGVEVFCEVRVALDDALYAYVVVAEVDPGVDNHFALIEGVVVFVHNRGVAEHKLISVSVARRIADLERPGQHGVPDVFVLRVFADCGIAVGFNSLYRFRYD